MTTLAPDRPDVPTRPRREWWIPASLLALTFVPVAAGVFRVAELAAGEADAADQRFLDSPLPVVVHVVGACLYTVLGAFQLMPDGRLAISSRRGEVWMVDDPFAKEVKAAQFHRFAHGLHEVLGLAERDGWLYVTQRDDLSRLRDSDGDKGHAFAVVTGKSDDEEAPVGAVPLDRLLLVKAAELRRALLASDGSRGVMVVPLLIDSVPSLIVADRPGPSWDEGVLAVVVAAARAVEATIEGLSRGGRDTSEREGMVEIDGDSAVAARMREWINWLAQRPEGAPYLGEIDQALRKVGFRGRAV